MKINFNSEGELSIFTPARESVERILYGRFDLDEMCVKERESVCVDSKRRGGHLRH